MFLDEAIITVIGGYGGKGCVSWRKEKYVPKGGPNGGDGGAGGDIVIIANDNTDTLSDYASKKKFEAQKGQMGMGSDKNGKCGETLTLKVPPGTLVSAISPSGKEERLADLIKTGQQVLVVHGGRGGYGNTHFKSSVRQAPDFAELGEPGEEKQLKLELKLVADVGIIGFPSVGKSTLISVISSAKPKIADYPFTTIRPNLGVVNVSDRSFVVCDVPGLIEDASKGKGLGDQFLRHIERCGILLHVLDLSRALEGTDVNADILKQDYETIRHELEAYSPTLAQKKEIVILNKIDLTSESIKKIEKQLIDAGIPLHTSISAIAKMNTEALMKYLLPLVLAERTYVPEEPREDIPVLKPHLESDRMGSYTINHEGDVIRVSGQRLEQFTKMTNFDQKGGISRFCDVIERIGLRKALERERTDDKMKIYIGDTRIDEYV